MENSKPHPRSLGNHMLGAMFAQPLHKTQIFFRILIIPFVLVCTPSYSWGSTNGFSQKLIDEVSAMKEGEWRELPGTKIPLISKKEIRSIQEKYGGDPLWGSIGPKHVIQGWTGAAFDKKNKRWYFFGGGHRGYGGNEVYEFDFAKLSWNRLTDPSPLTRTEGSGKTTKKQCLAPAVGPPAMHTYDGIQWNPVSESFWILIMRGYCADFSRSYSQPNTWWEFKPSTLQWTAHKTVVSNPGFISTAWNPVTKRIVALPRTSNQKENGPYEVDELGHIHRRGNFRYGVNPGILSYDADEMVMYATKKNKIYRQGLEGKSLPGWQPAATFPQAVKDANIIEAGFEYDLELKQFLIWTGGRETWSWSPESKKFHHYPNMTSKYAPIGKNRPRTKFIYLDELNVFAGYANPDQGVWIYKPVRLEQSSIVTNKERACIKEKCFSSIQHAFSAAKSGDTILIKKGIWNEGAVLNGNNIKILGEEGAHLKGAAEGKGALVIKGNNVTVEHIECSSIVVGDGNGACIRHEGGHLVVKDVYFHNAQQGILAGKNTKSVTIVDSRIENMGEKAHPLGRSHGIYISSDTLTVTNSTIIGTQTQGHEVKSRARVTTIENCVIGSAESEDSRSIDTPNGGIVSVTNSIIQKGRNSQNRNVFGFGLERGMKNVSKWKNNSLKIVGNTIIVDFAKGENLIKEKGADVIILRNNSIVGGNPQPGNCHYKNRQDAGLPPYPSLAAVKANCSLAK